MAEKYDITILTNQKSWMNKYNFILKSELENLGHCVKIIHSKKDLLSGDIAFFLSCFEIISEEYLNLHTHNIVVHASDLPKGKGWSPASWQILEGKNDIPITLFEATNSVDAGDYYIKDILHLDGYELIDDWQNKLGQKIIEMCLSYVKNYKNMSGISQEGDETFYKRRKAEDSELDINKTLKEQFNLLRIVDNNNYPAYFKYGKNTYYINIFRGGVKPSQQASFAAFVKSFLAYLMEVIYA